MGGPWKLERTKQCGKCPWRKSTDPNQIPDGYSVEKHEALEKTIASPGDLRQAFCGGPKQVMACHETEAAHCVGWLHHQLGPGNNIGLRIRMMTCTNARDVEVLGDQHERFEDTLPKGAKKTKQRKPKMTRQQWRNMVFGTRR